MFGHVDIGTWMHYEDAKRREVSGEKSQNAPASLAGRREGCGAPCCFLDINKEEQGESLFSKNTRPSRFK
jgi:hypothetical protein